MMAAEPSFSGKPVLGMILKGYPRISETFISNEILLLEQMGLPVHIFSMRHPREPFCHESVLQIRAAVDYLPTELLLEFPRLFLPAAQLAVQKPKIFLQAVRKAGERFHRTRSLGTLKHLLQGAYLTRRLLRKHPEVIHLHAHFAHSPTSVALFASMLSGLPFSFTAHAKDIYTSNREQLREKIDLARLVVTCTKHNRAYLQEIAPQTKTPLHCVYHGINLKLFYNKQQRPFPVEPYRILSVARLTEKKGIPTILRALARLHAQKVDFHYILIGDGDDRDDVIELIFQLGLEKKCRWLGTLAHEQVITEFNRADLFVLGCKIAANGDRDGIPNVLVESLALGLPAVGTNVSALPEILRPHETGSLVMPESPEALAKAMLEMLQNRDLREKSIVNGKALVAKEFDNRMLVRQLGQIFCHHIPQLHCQKPVKN